MNFIHGGRATGKTTLLLRQSAETGIPILTTNYFRIRLYKDYAEHLGLKIPEPILWRNRKLGMKDGSKVLIDNGEETINNILRANSGVTCETMVIDQPIKHLKGSFIDLSAFPNDVIGGRLDCLDAARYGLWAINHLPAGTDLIEALDSLVWYNGAYGDLAEVKKYIKTYDAPGVIPFPRHIFQGTENEEYTSRVVWFLMVCLFGNYGTSPRSGWIDRKNREKALSFLDAVMKTYRESDEYVEE